MRLSELSQHGRVAELLRLLGHDAITVEEFWQQMRQYGLTDADIDRFCMGASSDGRKSNNATRPDASDHRGSGDRTAPRPGTDRGSVLPPQAGDGRPRDSRRPAVCSRHPSGPDRADDAAATVNGAGLYPQDANQTGD